MKNRRNLTPPTGVPGAVHATRRAGARLEVSDRVTLRAIGAPGAPVGKVLEGWALNVGRGGVRVILEENVEPGASYEVTLTAGVDPPVPNAHRGASDGFDAGAPATRHIGRVVWVQDEPDGVVAGIEFTPEGDKP